MEQDYYQNLSWKPKIKKTNQQPLYLAIADQLKTDIQQQVLHPGDKLPPQRQLADFLQINVSTVTKAFKLCERQGLISAAIGRGTFISADTSVDQLIESDRRAPNLIEMGTVLPLYEQNALVAASIRKIVQKITIGKFLEYAEPHLQVSHRQTGCYWLHKFGMETIPANIMIASGAQNALAISLISLFSAGDKIAVDQLTYPGFKNLASLLGIRLIPIKADLQGMSPQALAKACKVEQIKGLYLMPECQNPTTITLSQKRRYQLADVIQAHQLILIEDDTYAFLNQTGIPPVSNLVPQQSIYISCTSKALSAGLRVAFMAVAPAFHDQIRRGIYNIDLNTSHFNVEIAANLIESKLADQIIDAKRKEAKKRNQLTDKILASYPLSGNEYDYFRWLKLPTKWNAKDFEYHVRAAGVQVYCSDRFAVGSQPVIPAIRLAIASPKNLAELRLGLEKIRHVLENAAPNSTPLII